MALFDQKRLSGFKSFCVNVLRQGPVPRHVALIMDGNRRYARQNEVEAVEGHSAGFIALLDALTWCRELGINEVTAFAFSIDNFNRPQEEVNNLLNLFRKRFRQLWDEREHLYESGVRVRAIGNLLLFPKDMQVSIAKVVDYTKDNNKYFLNMAIAYGGREEIFQAFKLLLEGVRLNLIQPDDITQDVFQRCLYTHDSPDPDLVIRTSGEVRLSGFYPWQTSYSVLMFIKNLWPAFSLWDMLYSVFVYQRAHNQLKAFKNKAMETRQQQENEQIRRKLLEKRSTCDNNNEKETITESDIDEYKLERENRLNKFYSYMEKKRRNLLKYMLLDEGQVEK